jgi:hypothetical protein
MLPFLPPRPSKLAQQDLLTHPIMCVSLASHPSSALSVGCPKHTEVDSPFKPEIRHLPILPLQSFPQISLYTFLVFPTPLHLRRLLLPIKLQLPNIRNFPCLLHADSHDVIETYPTSRKINHGGTPSGSSCSPSIAANRMLESSVSPKCAMQMTHVQQPRSKCPRRYLNLAHYEEPRPIDSTRYR